ncbi:MAG TPA: DUF4389 domain-containing protein [Pseudomonas sabulinigri]|uniref:Lipase n=1 Tax=marine sediment metagenome TaxID=412755 RepID=A0A0F9VGC4_9ZZZZ|nr:DUF4389 domain-containing protein [Halopseudomonas sabulinigri]HEC51570.1 DUF4389 domain-containing protein [Halopseudomonas sabulinigri]|tara:strand:- start:18266 stop:18595 length:330 start_codon:yes stop_codon:yes gene_type:complete
MHALKESLCSADFWLRLLYTILFMLAWQVVEILLALLVVIQIMSRLFTGSANEDAKVWGEGFSLYACQIGRYITQVSDQKPWPFIEWPQPATEPVVTPAPTEPSAEPKS